MSFRQSVFTFSFFHSLFVCLINYLLNDLYLICLSVCLSDRNSTKHLICLPIYSKQLISIFNHERLTKNLVITCNFGIFMATLWCFPFQVANQNARTVGDGYVNCWIQSTTPEIESKLVDLALWLASWTEQCILNKLPHLCWISLHVHKSLVM